MQMGLIHQLQQLIQVNYVQTRKLQVFIIIQEQSSAEPELH